MVGHIMQPYQMESMTDTIIYFMGRYLMKFQSSSHLIHDSSTSNLTVWVLPNIGNITEVQ